MYLDRVISLEHDLRSRSVFLFGPRQTGKTTLLRQRYPDAFWVNLLDGRQFLKYSAEPWRLAEETTALTAGSIVVIDEIQRLPVLLNEVHDLIETRDFRFVLTGSSPVKLRRGGVNLLGGRARLRYLSPLVFPEIPEWDLHQIVVTGTLPSVYLSDEPWEDLRSYAGLYLQHEVQAEGLVRGIDGFSRFLHTAAHSAGRQIVFEQTASDAQVPARTVREYFGILEQTLIGRMVAPYQPAASTSRKPVARGKFFFFDVGVVQALTGRRTVAAGTPEYGSAVEQYLFTELEAWVRYQRLDAAVTFWRTVGEREVDFVIPDRFAIEVKAGGSVGRGDLKGLIALREDAPELRPIVVCGEDTPRVIDGIDVLPVRIFLERLWAGTL
ncbi:MAG: AAA family ATPase [Alkalispirochaeta sp.]